MKAFMNESKDRLLKIVFKDRDEIHLRYGETLYVETERFPVVQVRYV